MPETGADHLCILLSCGHGSPRWIGPGDSVLSRLWCSHCNETVAWVRAGWSGLVSAYA